MGNIGRANGKVWKFPVKDFSNPRELYPKVRKQKTNYTKPKTKRKG